MRAIYFEQLQNLDSQCELKDEKFHHLVNVLRAKEADQILFLDGKGFSRLANIETIKKKSLTCIFIEDLKDNDDTCSYAVAIGKTKREALELSLKQLVEIGVKTIYLVESEFSQRYSFKEDRLKKILISALEQSNATHLPSVKEVKLENLTDLNFKNIFYFSSTRKKDELGLNPSDSNLILIGPEGGFSSSEEDLLEKIEGLKTINLKTNIMRAPTAVAYCMGYCSAKLNK
jgi:16S rRNA (uracil1498-N3)-methyltransferase